MTAAVRRSRHDERGVVAGAEGLMVGALVLITGTLLVVHLWGVVQMRSDLQAAAVEYLRTYGEADDPATATATARSALAAALGHRQLGRLSLVEPDPTQFGPCALATLSVRTDLPGTRLPFVGPVGRTQVVVTRSELVDPHREMTAGTDFDPAATPCGTTGD
jgi:hypothetical protein